MRAHRYTPDLCPDHMSCHSPFLPLASRLFTAPAARSPRRHTPLHSFSSKSHMHQPVCVPFSPHTCSRCVWKMPHLYTHMLSSLIASELLTACVRVSCTIYSSSDQYRNAIPTLRNLGTNTFLYTANDSLSLVSHRRRHEWRVFVSTFTITYTASSAPHMHPPEPTCHSTTVTTTPAQLLRLHTPPFRQRLRFTCRDSARIGS